MLYPHGNRLNTIKNIKIDDVNIEKKMVYLRKLKSGETQELPLCDIMIIILKHYMEVRKNLAGEYLFCTYLGDKFSSRGLQTAIEAYNKSRNVEKSSLHLYRHKFAETFCKSNGNIFKLQILLNHKTLEMTRHYVMLYANDLRKDINNSNPLEIYKTIS
ncbi:tyrosine-type recombinase/integrase [Robinsoniella peoriensis]|uniref:tyrosine-type recombinase/integrase n=1 Tax=Robinsoniella peoriensis TaxID=180332 RepID=UPI0037522260